MSTEADQLNCAECGAGLILKHGKFGKFYRCERFPLCTGGHGAHPDGRPMGFPADRETRRLRHECHIKLDKLWQSGECSRPAAYRVLQKIMRMSEEEAHIGKFNKEQCLYLLRQFDMLGDAIVVLIPAPDSS